MPDFERSYLNCHRLTVGSALVYSDADHVWEFDRGELKALVLSCGLAVVDDECRFGMIRLWCERAPEEGGRQAAPL